MSLDPVKCRRVIDQRWGHLTQPDAGGCVLWLAATDREGYALVKFEGRMVRAARLVWAAHAGADPGVAWVTHGCGEPACVNEDHLAAELPPQLNQWAASRAARNSRKPTCIRGHELGIENVTRGDGDRGYRRCRECARERAAAVSAAHALLGISFRDYIAQYGGSRRTAEKVIRNMLAAEEGS